MGDTSISWTDKTWNPIRGCSRVSEGCRNCYAERVAVRFSGPGQPYEGLAQVVAPRDHMDRVGGRRNGWTREVRFVAEHLADPLRWRKPQRVFVNSMSDLFHEKLTNEQIAAVFGVMAAAPQHTFQVLTKRAKRMREWFDIPGTAELVEMFRQVALAGRIEEYFAPKRIFDIAEWPGYAVTSKGRVLSTKRGDEREMTAMRGEQGHGRVMLYRNGTTERPLVHRLVLEAFDRPARDGEQGCHIDGDPTNNALWNLRWGTQSENWDDSKRHGTRRRYSKLTDEQVVELRRLADEGISGAELGRRFGISDTQARNIASGVQWKPEHRPEWPLRSVWLGVSVENQAAADERIPELMRTPAAVRFLSCEPLLGPIDLDPPLCDREHCGPDEWGLADDEATPWCNECDSERSYGHWLHCDGGIDWVIAGCESGPGARPCSVGWLRALRDQCAAAGVPYFLKQARESVVERCDACGQVVRYRAVSGELADAACGCTVEGPEACSSRGVMFGDVSTRKAGGVIELPYLDGVQWAQFPEAK